MKISRAAAGLAVLALVASGCGSGNSGGGNGHATVNLSLDEDVDTLLPMDANVGDNIKVLDVVYDGLVRYDPKTTEPHNYVAQSIESKDNVHWTIKLKPGLKFQNGEPVDADAFARAWNYAAYGPNAMANNYFFERFVGYDDMQGETDDSGKVTVQPKAKTLSGLVVKSPTELDVTLTGPFAGFSTMLGYTGFFPVAKACLDDIKACKTKPIGNGPFKVTKWNQGEEMDLAKWSAYKGAETPKTYDKIHFTEYKGGDEWPDFQSGTLDAADVPPEQVQAAANDPDLSQRKVQSKGAALTYLGFPMYKGAPWNNLDFRKAISLAIDRDAIAKAVLPGQRVPADSWVAPDAVPGGAKGTCEWCHYDKAAAQAALKKAGGWPKGKTMTISLGDDDTEAALFKAIGDQLKLNLGIPYTLDPTPDFFDDRSGRKFTGPFRNNWFPDYPLNENYLAPTYVSGDPKKGDESFGYYDKAFEDAIAAGDGAPDLDAAVKKYQDAEKVLAKDFPTIPLFFDTTTMYYGQRLSNVVLDPFSGEIKLRLLKVSE